MIKLFQNYLYITGSNQRHFRNLTSLSYIRFVIAPQWCIMVLSTLKIKQLHIIGQ